MHNLDYYESTKYEKAIFKMKEFTRTIDTLSAKNQERETLNRDIEEFIKSGGKITKPDDDYKMKAPCYENSLAQAQDQKSHVKNMSLDERRRYAVKRLRAMRQVNAAVSKIKAGEVISKEMGLKYCTVKRYLRGV
jgi:hypothetical protein